VREPPDVAKTDGATGRDSNKTQTGAELFSLVQVNASFLVEIGKKSQNE